MGRRKEKRERKDVKWVPCVCGSTEQENGECVACGKTMHME